MKTHNNKPKENKIQINANNFSGYSSFRKPTLQFEDNRPEAILQRKLQQTANNSPQSKEYAQLQVKANQYTSTAVQRSKQLEEEKPIQKMENQIGLPTQLKSGIENLSGLSMDDVKVHYNSSKPAQLQAHAYAQGSDIHLASGQEKHLPHEAWHVVQQKQGRVKPILQMKGNIKINDDTSLEKEADVMGQKALSEHQFIQRKEVISSSPILSDFTIQSKTIQLCKNPQEIGTGKTAIERIKDFLVYAREMSEKAADRGFGLVDDSEKAAESEAFYGVSEKFDELIVNLKKGDGLSEEEAKYMIDTYEEIIADANEAYEKVKRGDFKKEDSYHSGKGAPAEMVPEDSEDSEEVNPVFTKVDSLPGKSDMGKLGIKGVQKVGKRNIGKICIICEEMISLKEAMIHGDGDAQVKWMELFWNLFDYFQAMSVKSPDEYMGLLQCGVIDAMKGMSKMMDKGVMCNEELPLQIKKSLGK